jgi:hypothetical protein
MTAMYLRIRIDSTPRGEAPLWVREKWVGLELPLAQLNAEPSRVQTGAGVLSGPKNIVAAYIAWLMGRLKPEVGFLVEVTSGENA